MLPPPPAAAGETGELSQGLPPPVTPAGQGDLLRLLQDHLLLPGQGHFHRRRGEGELEGDHQPQGQQHPRQRHHHRAFTRPARARAAKRSTASTTPW